MRLRTALCVCLLTVLGTPVLAQPGDSRPKQAPAKKPVDLRPRFRVGEEVRFNMELHSNRTLTGAAPKSDDPLVPTTSLGEGKQDITLTLALKCTAADPEAGYSIDMKIEKLKMDGSIGGEPTHFDSSKPVDDADPLAAALNSIVGTTIPIKMGVDGNISGIGAGLTGVVPGADMLSSIFGPLSTLQKGTGQAHVGDSWTNEDVMEGALGTIRIKTTNTLRSHNGGTANVVTKGSFTLDPSSSKAGVRIREGDLSGDFKWNTEEHMLDSMNFRKKLTLEKRNQRGQPSVATDDVTLKVTRLGGRRGH